MFFHGGNTHDLFGRLACLVLCFMLQFPLKDRALCQVLVWSPSRGDFATCKLTAEEKEKFLDEHNKFRGMVKPTAADMEYLEWDDNLANMAQMWVNNCRWGHGFLKWGGYPNPPVTMKGQLGQNLAMEVAISLPNPVDRVERWYNETNYYTFSKYTSPMSSAVCTKKPCGHYTQLMWAKTKYVGCAVNVCSKLVPTGSYYGRMDGKYVACNYAPAGNVRDQYPYKTGTPCTKCASGKGFCYNNLCKDGSKTTTTPALVTVAPTQRPPVTAAPIPPPITISPTVAPTPPVVYPTPAVPQVCSADQHSSCEGWAAVGECEKNALWMIPNCCVSCKYHQAPKDCIDTSPRCLLWAYNGECEENRAWMSNNCRKSCNVCDDCKDTDAKCPSWALLGQCSTGNKITNCRQSCGLCKVYDRHNECPAWSAQGECKKSNWTWMADHCPRSCDVPFSEASFCGGKINGNYQAPTTCQGYIACSNGVTSHVACPAGEKYDAVKRFCEPANRAICKVVIPSKTSKSWKMIATLKKSIFPQQKKISNISEKN
ncbi:uncharacterized protein LOC144645798 [Oculina patagonica]